VTFFTDNNDFFGGNRLAQDPLYAVQEHLIYHFDFGPDTFRSSSTAARESTRALAVASTRPGSFCSIAGAAGFDLGFS